MLKGQTTFDTVTDVRRLLIWLPPVEDLDGIVVEYPGSTNPYDLGKEKNWDAFMIRPLLSPSYEPR